MPPKSPVSSKASAARREPLRTTGKEGDGLWTCHNRFPLSCLAHPGERVSVRCGRWRTCVGCGLRKQWELRQRFIAGVRDVPPGKVADFFTLTFPSRQAPDETQAHVALRSLVRRLRHRGYLGAYGWVLQRQGNGTLHYHGIAHLPWFADDLAEWRGLIQASGFGPQNKLLPARREHAGYCARYISTRLATVAPLRRAFAFSRDFPRSGFDVKRREIAELGSSIGMEPECDWVPTAWLA